MDPPKNETISTLGNLGNHREGLFLDPVGDLGGSRALPPNRPKSGAFIVPQDDRCSVRKGGRCPGKDCFAEQPIPGFLQCTKRMSWAICLRKIQTLVHGHYIP